MLGEAKGGIGERIFAGALGLVFVGQFLLALRYPPEPRLFPLIVAVAGGALTLALASGRGLHDHQLGAAEKLPRARFLLTLAVSPAYALALWLFGYWVATLAAIPLIAIQLGYRNKRNLALVTVLTSLVLGIIFPMLEVPLPKGLLASMLR